MIVTLTLNPSVDRTIFIDRLELGAVTRVDRATVEPAGKGVNVARALHANGVATRAVIPVGGNEGAVEHEMLTGEGLDVVAVPIAGAIRSNVSVVERDGRVTKLNEPGPRLTGDEVERLLSAAAEGVGRGDWLVVSGSMPPGVSPDVYGELTTRIRTSGGRIAVDTSGPPLGTAIDHAADLVKPNLGEAEEWAEAPLATLGDVVDTAHRMLQRGVGAVLASLGQAGAVLVTRDVALHGLVEVDEVRNTVGAGDALLAGYLAGNPGSVDAFRTALVWAAAAVRSPVTGMAAPGDIDAAVVSNDIDRSLRLSTASR